MRHRRVERHRPVGTSFIGSFDDGPDQSLIVLCGDIDAAAVERLELHIDGLLGAGTRFLTIDAAAVDGYAPQLVPLLGYTQRRLGARVGIVAVRGLPPDLPSVAVIAPKPVPASVGPTSASAVASPAEHAPSVLLP